MSFIVQSELDMELSSDEESITLPSNRLPNTRNRSSSPDTQCSICLDGLTNKCYSDSCLHLFCFECLKRWSISEPSCPLCKQRFNNIFHSFDDQGDHQIYNVPQRISPRGIVGHNALFLRINSDLEHPTNQTREMEYFFDILRRIQRNELARLTNTSHLVLNERDRNEPIQFINANTGFPSPTLRTILDQATRIRVYSDNAWAVPIPDQNGHFREYSSDYFRINPVQVHRLQSFIMRDLAAIRESVIRSNDQSNLMDYNATTLTDLIMRTLTVFGIREGFMVNIIRPFLRRHALHFCHELYNFALSSYNIIDYDRSVLFTRQPTTAIPSNVPPENRENDLNMLLAYLPPLVIQLEDTVQPTTGGIIVLDSENGERQLPRMEVTDVNSSSDYSNVEILSFSVRPIESQNSASINQPSTSTGNQASLDLPNNRYNLRRLGLQSLQSIDSSSSDEESINGT